MARFEIVGAHRVTGDTHTFTIDAQSERDAELAARKRGVLVSTIRAVGESSRKEEQTVETLANRGEPTITVVKTVPPGYRPIVTGAAVLKVFAIIAYIAGAIGLLFVIVTRLQNASSSEIRTSEEKSMILSIVIASLSSIVVGAVLNLLAHLSLAVRDIARNSFNNQGDIDRQHVPAPEPIPGKH